MRASAPIPIVAGAALACFAPAQARAQEQQAIGFTGPRIELMVGFDATELPNADGPETMYGVRFGYDREYGKWVIGGELDLSTSNADRTVTDVFVPGDRLRVHYGRDVYAGVRSGRILTRWLAFSGKGGLALTRMHSEYSEGPLSEVPPQDDGTTSPQKFARPGTLLGFWVGGGFEYRISRKVFAVSEYRYSNFHDGLYRHQAIATLGLRF